MSSVLRDIRVGDSIWSTEKKNGIITDLDYEDQTVFANHYDNGHAEYEFDDLLGCYDERLNQWVVVKPW